MKTLILGEILNGTLSSGTLEIIKKAQDESIDYQVVKQEVTMSQKLVPNLLNKPISKEAVNLYNSVKLQI